MFLRIAGRRLKRFREAQVHSRTRGPPQLGEGVYDFLEWYAGTAQMTESWAKRGDRPEKIE